MALFPDTNMYENIEQWNDSAFKPYRRGLGPWSPFNIFGQDASSRTSAIEAFLSYNGSLYVGNDYEVASEPRPAIQDSYRALDGNGGYHMSHTSQESEYENPVIPQGFTIPSATHALPTTLVIRSKGDMTDSVSEGTHNTDETQSQCGRLGQYQIPDQSVNPANLHILSWNGGQNGYTPDHEQLGPVPWCNCKSCEPSLCSSVDTASTSSLPSIEEESSVDSDSNTKCISLPVIPNSTYKAKRKQFYRSEKDTFQHNRKTGRIAGAKATKSKKKITFRTCEACKKDFSEAEYKWVSKSLLYI